MWVAMCESTVVNSFHLGCARLHLNESLLAACTRAFKHIINRRDKRCTFWRNLHADATLVAIGSRRRRPHSPTAYRVYQGFLGSIAILIHNLLVLGQFTFSGSSLFHFDMLACLLPSSGVKSGIQWCTAAVFYLFFFSRLIETVLSKCDQAGTHHGESGQHGLNNLLNA